MLSLLISIFSFDDTCLNPPEAKTENAAEKLGPVRRRVMTTTTRRLGRRFDRAGARAWKILSSVSFALALLTLSATAARTQQAPLENYAGFKGQTVSHVDVAIGPGVKLEDVLRLIQQKAGKPFSLAAIQKSMAALRATKKFSAVQLTVEPQSAGLDLLFTLQPASYIGVLEFPGALKAFPYTRLLEAANVPAESPFYDRLPRQAEHSLVRFFRQEGYFRPDVQTTVVRDDPHRIVNLIFHTDLGIRAKVGKIAIEGIPRRQANGILGHMGSFWTKLKRKSLTPGQTFSQTRIQQAIIFMRQYMQGQGRLTATVRFLAPKYDPETNRANLEFRIRPGPAVSVKVKGAKISSSALNSRLPIYPGGLVNRSIAGQGQRSLQDYFQARGYVKAKVSTQFRRDPGRVTIDYSVHLGHRYRIAEVTFQGNHYFDEDRLEAASAIKDGKAILGFTISHGQFSSALVSQSEAAIATLYKNAGFAGVSVHSKVSETRKTVHVTFTIDEGAQDKVATLRVEGNRTEPLRVISGGQPLHLAPGKPFSQHAITQDRNEILANYYDLGYLNAQFQSTVSRSHADPHRMNVVYRISEGPQGQITAVLPVGERVTRPDFLKKTAERSISQGKPLSQGAFYTAESHLYKLNIFDWVSVGPLEPLASQQRQEVLVKVHESSRYTMNVGGGVEVLPRSANIPVGAVALPGLPTITLGNKFTASQKSFWGPRFSFSLARHNILGRAETATLATVLSRLTQSGEITYADPRFVGSSWSSLFGISAQRTTANPIYTAALGQAFFRADKTLGSHRTKNLILRYGFQYTDLTKVIIPGLVLPQDRHVRLSTFSAEYVHDTRDNPLNAHHGIFQTFSFGVTPTALGSSANFVRLLGQNAFYVPVRPWLTWANNVRLGFAIPFSGSAVPLTARFFSGGADSLRGFPINGAGPQRPVPVCSNPSDPSTCTLISVPIGGDMLFILNSEARFPLHLLSNLGGVFFYDGGNVYKNINFPQLIDNYTNTIGAGLRYTTPVGPIRFDVGYRLTPIPGVRALQYFVTIGQAF
jgi:outer membrane protein insertion porin family